MPTPKVTPPTLIPATPGWSIAFFIAAGTHGGETWGDSLLLEPIIAWAIDYEVNPDLGNWHDVTPVTIEGTTHIGEWAIKRPDGKFQIPDDTTLDDESAAIAHLKEAAAKADKIREKLRERV